MLPFPSTSLRAVSSARSDTLPPPRRIGICPAARKNHAVFHESKYSALARNVTLRRTTNGMKKESQKDWWLAARTTGPFAGMFSRPSTFTRHRTKKIGVRIALSTQYLTGPRYPRWAASAPGLAGSAGQSGGRPIVVAGDSAGGNLAAVSALRARDSGGPPVALQVLVYPVVDCDLDRRSYRECDGDELILNRRDMVWFWDHYAADPASRSNPYASPLRAPSLSGLPPVYLVTAEHDPLRDEGFAYADRLRAARAQVEHRHYGSQIHGFFTFTGVLDDADKAVAEAGSAIRSAVEGS